MSSLPISTCRAWFSLGHLGVPEFLTKSLSVKNVIKRQKGNAIKGRSQGNRTSKLSKAFYPGSNTESSHSPRPWSGSLPSAALKYSGFTEAYSTPLPNLLLFLSKKMKSRSTAPFLHITVNTFIFVFFLFHELSWGRHRKHAHCQRNLGLHSWFRPCGPADTWGQALQLHWWPQIKSFFFWGAGEGVRDRVFL